MRAVQIALILASGLLALSAAADAPPPVSEATETCLICHAIELRWADIWLFYANSIRFTAAMAGGGDYAVFADGHYTHSKRVKELQEWLEERRQSKR